jgi:N-acetylmuramoyl-L-alanine amidase
MKKKIELIMTICLLVSAALIARQSAIITQQTDADSEPVCIVIDPGHGGADPGKIGINNALEKDINLELALKLKDLLTNKGINVVMTRDSDDGLYSEDSVNKKVDDMQQRCLIISEVNPVFTVSLHQNSYTTDDVSGAQVFYYGQSAEGKILAETLQASLVTRLDPDNHRTAKANESYYLLKKTPTPTVIVECGFLSNPDEANLLIDEDYQNRLVRAIYMGICDYLNSYQADPASVL